jgi:hypothetical protein
LKSTGTSHISSDAKVSLLADNVKIEVTIKTILDSKNIPQNTRDDAYQIKSNTVSLVETVRNFNKFESLLKLSEFKKGYFLIPSNIVLTSEKPFRIDIL